MRLPGLTRCDDDHADQAGRRSRHAGTDNDAYRAMRTQLQAFIARRVESPQAAEDLTQEVLLRLVRSNADELADPAAWLYRVARNVIIDHYRTRRPDPAGVEDQRAIELAEVDPFARRPIASAPRTRPMPALTHQPARRAIPIRDHRGRPRRAEPTPPSPASRAERPGMKSRVQRARRQLRHLLTDCCTVELSATLTVTDYSSPPGCAPGQCT